MNIRQIALDLNIQTKYDVENKQNALMAKNNGI